MIAPLTEPASIAQTIRTIEGRLRQEHGVESRIGLEWEFQLLDSDGNAVEITEIETLLSDQVQTDRIYRERAHGLVEATSPALPPLEAAENMAKLQSIVKQYATEKGYVLSTRPIVMKQDKMTGSAGVHVNSSMIQAEDASDPDAPSILGMTSNFSQVDQRTANITNALLEVNNATPAWSFHDADDINRIRYGDGTPTQYNASDASQKDKGGAVVRNNSPVPYFDDELDQSPIPGQPAFDSRIEERFPNSRVDPYVTVFRTVLGQYHGMNMPIEQGKEGSLASIKYINHGSLPTSAEEITENHLPEGNVFEQYIDDLYSQQELNNIDEIARATQAQWVSEEKAQILEQENSVAEPTPIEKQAAPTNNPQPLTRQSLQEYVNENGPSPLDLNEEDVEQDVRLTIFNQLRGLGQGKPDFEQYFANVRTLDDIETIIGRLQPEMVAFETQRRALGVDMHTTATSWVQPRLIEHLSSYPEVPAALETPKAPEPVVASEWGNLPNGWETTERYSSTKGSLEFINPKFVSASTANRTVLQKGAKWKLHINVPDNRNDPLTKEIAEYLITRTDLTSFKIGVGDEDFLNNGNQPVYNGMTVYVGSHDEARKVAEEISAKFADKLQEYEEDKAPGQEMYLLPGISMRFDAKSYAHAKDHEGKSQSYGKYGAGGISELSSQPTRFCNPVLNSGGKYPFEGKDEKQVAAYKTLAKVNMDKLVDEFGDYLLGEGATEKYLASGRKIEALPQWANDWCNLKWRELSGNSVTQQQTKTVEVTPPPPPVVEPEAPKKNKPTSSRGNTSTNNSKTTKTETDDKGKGFSWTKVGVMLGAVGVGSYIGNSKEPVQNSADKEQPEKKQNWFKRNVKMFAKALMFLVAIDMGQSMIRGTKSYTEQGIGKFTNMINAERNNAARDNGTKHL